MKVEAGQIWQEDETGIVVEVLSVKRRAVRLRELDAEDGAVWVESFVRLYENYTFMRNEK